MLQKFHGGKFLAQMPLPALHKYQSESVPVVKPGVTLWREMLPLAINIH